MSRVCGNGKRRRKMFRRLARKTAEALMPPLASRSRRNPPMEQLLIKMARQLDALDEASLLALWDKYAVIVSHFEPTKRWEEAALVFRSFRPSGGKTSCSITAGRRRYIPARRRSRRGAGLFLDPPTGRPAPAKPKRNRDYPVPPAPQSRGIPPKSPAEKAEAAGKPFFPPDSR